MPTCSVSNCNRLARSKSLCNAHYLRFRKTGKTDSNKPIADYSRNPEEKSAWIEAAVKSKTNICLPWPWGCDSDGYGWVKIQGKPTAVHRLVLKLATGRDSDLFVCHRCDNPTCCNPRHLFFGTHNDNMQDAVQKGRVVYRLTESDVRTIRSRYESEPQTTQQMLADEFGVNQQQISRVVNNHRWKHIK